MILVSHFHERTHQAGIFRAPNQEEVFILPPTANESIIEELLCVCKTNILGNVIEFDREQKLKPSVTKYDSTYILNNQNELESFSNSTDFLSNLLSKVRKIIFMA